MACPETRVGPGWEAQFATNHLGHFALANRLWPLLADGGARVVALTSTGHKISGIRFDDLQFEHDYDKWQAYGQAKSANSLFAVHLDALGQDAGVRAFAVHPGGIFTPLQRHLTREEMQASGWISDDGTPDERFKTPEQGASTSTWAATNPKLAGMGGVYCENCDIAEPTPVGSPTARIEGVDAHAIDPDVAARLWTVSAAAHGSRRVRRRLGRRSEPGGERVGEPRLALLSDPGDVSVGPDQHGRGSGDRPEHRKLPRAGVLGVDQLHAIRPRRDVEAAGLAEVEQHRPGIVQQREDPQRAVGGDEVEIGHAAPEQRVPLAEVVVDVQAGHHRGEALARLVHAEELGDGLAQGLGAVVGRRSATCAIVLRSTRAATGWRSAW